jgi:hypothetical protein
MTVSGSIYFLGEYRPAYFEADNFVHLASAMVDAVRNLPDRQWFAVRIRQAAEHMGRSNCSAWSADHCSRGVSMAKRPHDPFLDDITRTLPVLPGLDYSNAVYA